MSTLSASGLCSRFAEELEEGPFTGQVNSVFNSALNIGREGKMYSVLPESRRVFPYSCTVGDSISFKSLRPEMKVLLSRSSILIPEAFFYVDLRNAVISELKVWREFKDPIEGLSEGTNILTELLGSSDGEFGMSPLVTGEKDNIYSAAVKTKLSQLHLAFTSLDPELAETAASRLAGCGMGLTPSSDDLISGYICAFTALCAVRGYPKREKVLHLTRSAANAAASKTNEISASFLRQSGEGLASQDVLELLGHLFSVSPRDELINAGRRVLAFGSTSGADILTGIILAINFHYGR